MKVTLEEAKRRMGANGGGLYLSNTQITSLPDNLTVGGWLDLRNTQITDKENERAKVKRLKGGDYAEGRYIFCDNCLTHIKGTRRVGDYTLYIGRIKGRNVVSDGTHFAHCDKLRDGIADIAFKRASDRGADQYKDLTLDTELTRDEMITMYRIITGACRQGTDSFVNSLRELKDKYTIRSAIEITRGQYNSERFAEFFKA